MKQVLHIFAKDVRHFRLEILVSVAITAAFAAVAPSQWSSGSGLHAVSGSFVITGADLQLVAGILALLVPIAWWNLITRVIQDEGLVGDRQFWITRPYEWKKLLASKIIFLLVFLYLPLVVAQCALLLRAGFDPLAYVPGLLYNLGLITIGLVLPLVAIATVTSNFARVMLSLLIILLFILGGEILSSIGLDVGISTGNSTSLLLLCVLVAVILVQYKSRRLWLSRSLLIAIPFLMEIIALANPQSAVIARTYSHLGDTQNAPVAITFPSELNGTGTAMTSPKDRSVTFHIPLHLAGVGEQEAIHMDNFTATFTAANGARWTTPWKPMQVTESFLPGRQYPLGVDVEVSKAFFDQARTQPVSVYLTFAVTRLRAGEVHRIPLPEGDFAVPGFGVCSSQSGPYLADNFGIDCKSPLRQPRLTYISAQWSKAPCSAPVSFESASWIGNSDSAPAEFGISPVSKSSFNSYSSHDEDKQQSPDHLCPGTPITFTRYNVVQQLQTELTIPNFKLPDYATRFRGAD